MAADDTPGPRKQPRFKGTGAPSTAADLNIVGDYAALVGNRKVGTTDERNTATTNGEVWPGLLWRDTTLKTEFIYVDGATGWVVYLEDTGWSALALQNGWSNFSNGAYQTMQHRRLNRVVAVEGTMQGGDGAPGKLLFVLPAGSRPLKYIVVTVWSNGQARPIEIAPNGNVVVGDTQLSSARTDIAFTFLADQ